MSTSPHQPTLPAEIAWTDAERNFLDESPPEFFPENQDSNIGLFRKITSDQTQAAADQLTLTYSERFVTSAVMFLSEWERQMGLPVDPALDDITRRARILTRLKQGAFTRNRRSAIVEEFIVATFGEAITFGPDGVAIGPGLSLFSDSGEVTDLYRIYEDVQNFSYEVWIDSTVTPDIDGLTRELDHFTPSGISYVIDNTKTDTALIDWTNTIIDFSPNGWWKLDTDYNDYSGLGNDGTVTGAPTVIASPGLITAGEDGARDFSGSGQYVTIPDSEQLNPGIFSIFAVVRPDTLPASDSVRFIYAASSDSENCLDISNIPGQGVKFGFTVFNGTEAAQALSTTTPVVGTTYTLLGVFDGRSVKLYVNGILEGSDLISGTVTLSGDKKIAADGSNNNLWDGGLDEIILFPHPLTAENALYLNNQASKIL